MTDLPNSKISDEDVEIVASVLGASEPGISDEARESHVEIATTVLERLVASGWRPEADVRREVQRSLSLAGLAALRCIPDGEIRNGCVIHDGAKVRERFRQAFLAITADRATALEPPLPLPVADGREIERESIEDALENDRCGICGSVAHFREDHPVSAGIPLPPASNELREHPGTGQPMEGVPGTPDGVEREYVLGQERSEEQKHG